MTEWSDKPLMAKFRTTVLIARLAVGGFVMRIQSEPSNTDHFICTRDDLLALRSEIDRLLAADEPAEMPALDDHEGE